MTATQTAAVRYLTPPEDAFWRWTGFGGLVEWTSGTTIAFRSELLQVLQPFASSGLPPLDLVLLVLAACRNSWKGDAAQLELLKEALSVRVLGNASQLLDQVIQGLDWVHALPAGQRTDVAKKVELVQFLFAEHPQKLPRDDSRAVLDLLQTGVLDDLQSSAASPIKTVRMWIRELQALRDALQRLDWERIALWTETGLEELIRPAPLPDEELLKAPVSPRRVLDDLSQDPELRGIARVARHLMAIVHLPRPIDEEQELPLGGVSDITNRGSFDRLLLSELAQDNDTLMVRVALNEALYLRRERPPATPPRECGVLVDSGLRMWGVPRVFATAVALSFSLIPERTPRVFRASGDSAVPIDLTAAAGLRAHLSVLNPQVHPGDALPAFAAALGDGAHDVVLVTGEDVLQDPRFRRALSESGLTSLILASVSRAGRLRLIERSPRGEKLLLEATLDIDDLYEVQPAPAPQPRPKARPLLNNPGDADLPTIMRLKSFPLRLSHQIRDAATFRVTPRNREDEPAFLSITDDRRLMLWNHKGWGGVQLTDRLPAPHLVWSGAVDRRGEVACVLKSNDARQLFVVRCKLDGSPARWFELPLDEPAHHYQVSGYGGDLFLVSRKLQRIVMHDLEQGTKLGSTPLPQNAVLARDRFVFMEGAWCAICSSGAMPRLQVVVPADKMPLQWVATLFDSAALQKPLAVTTDGNVFDPATTHRWTVAHGLKPPLIVGRVSPDGSTFELWEPSPRGPTPLDKRRLVHFGAQDCRVEPVRSTEWKYQSGAAACMLELPRRTRLQSIGVVNGELMLGTGKYQYLLRLDPTRRIHSQQVLEPSLQLFRRSQLRALPCREVVHFGRPSYPPDRRLKLRRAAWPDGSTAILDSRGLLHFKSSDANIPEFTLVLDDRDVAGWGADGRVWGTPYYTGNAAATPVADVLQTLIRPFIEHLS